MDMPDKAPLICVGMPVYNGELFLAEAIESILGQSVGDLELIISDNASTDGTQDICRSLAARDSRIRYMRQVANLGASENYNTVFRNSRSQYFKWASSNDVCHREFLAKCLDALRDRPNVVLCYPRTRMFVDDPASGSEFDDGFDASDDDPCRRFVQVVRRLGYNNVMNGVMRSDVLRKTNLIKPYFGSDIVLMAELALCGKFLEIPEFLFFRRVSEKSATHFKTKLEIVRHYYPADGSTMRFPNWKLHLGYLSVAVKAPLDLGDRTRVLLAAVRHMWWAQSRLVSDLRLRGA